MGATSRVFDLSAGLARERVYVGAAVLVVIQCPSTAALKIGIEHGDPVSASRGMIFRVAAGFEFVELTADAVAGGVLELAFGAAGDDFSVASAGSLAVEAVQGSAGPDPWAVFDTGARAGIGAPDDAEAAAGNGSLVALVKALRTLLGPLTFVGGASGSQVVTAAAPGVTLVDFFGSIGRNARYGHVQAHPDNAGLVTVDLAHDGATWRTQAWLPPGADFDFTGMDVRKVRVGMDVAGDSALVGGW